MVAMVTGTNHGDLQQIKAINILAWMEEGLINLLEKLLTVDGGALVSFP